MTIDQNKAYDFLRKLAEKTAYSKFILTLWRDFIDLRSSEAVLAEYKECYATFTAYEDAYSELRNMCDLQPDEEEELQRILEQDYTDDSDLIASICKKYMNLIYRR